MSSQSLLPFNATGLELALEASMCRAWDITILNDTLWNPDTCPANLLPWLAWAFSVDTWDTHWPIETKRNIIANSIEVHRKKGTLASIKRVLSGIDIQADISEWFDYDGIPHTFRITAWTDEQTTGDGDPILNPTLYRTLVRVVDDVKPVRSHYEFRVGVRFESEFGFYSLANTVAHIRQTVEPVVDTTTRADLVVPNTARVVPYLRIDAVLTE